MKPSLSLSIACAISLVSCGNPDPNSGPMVETPPHAKVDLSQVQLSISKVTISRTAPHQYQLDFDYTLNNQSGAGIAFQSIFRNKDELIHVQLNDQNGDPLDPGKRPLSGLTLAEPRRMLIPRGKTRSHYSVPLLAELRPQGDPITVQARFHAPSRYDELRSSLQAPPVTTLWPKNPEGQYLAPDQDPEEYPLTSPVQDATPLPQH